MAKGKSKAGAPPIYRTPEELQRKIDEYFNGLEFSKEPATITGLCLSCDFESRQSFYDYEKRDEFSYTIKRARLRIEHVYEKMLASKNSTGAIFALKNFDWSDKQEIDHTTGGQPFTLNVKPEK